MINNIYPFIVNNAMVPVGDIVLQTSISKNLRFLSQSDRWSREKLDSYREKKLKQMLFFCYQNVPYYREEWSKLNLEIKNIRIKDISLLPVIDKKTIKENFEKFIPINLDTNKVRLDSTGGSTGIPLKYYLSKDAYSWSKAVLYRMYGRANFRVGQRLITLAGSSLSSRKKMDIKKRIFYDIVERSKKISSFDLNESKMHEYYNLIRDFNPLALRGYANALYEFAVFLEANNLSSLNITNVFSAAEKLESHKREKIEEIFNLRVFDGYGAADGTIFAHECEEHNGLHIDEEVTITEVVDDNGNSTDTGWGELVTTSLVNFAFPFIRYKVGDLAQISTDKCSCGRQTKLLRKIVGRNHEFISLKNGTKIHGEFFSHAVRENTPEIDQFSVHQYKDSSIKMKIISNNCSDQSLVRLKNIISKKLEGLDVHYSFVNEINTISRSGKWKFISSEFKK